MLSICMIHRKNLRRLLDEQTIDTMELVAELEHMSDNFR